MDISHLELSDIVDQLLAGGHMIRLRATGQSMAPFLRGGETVTIERVPFSAIQRGDVILWQRHSGGLILHRVVSIRRGRGKPAVFQTQGDALPAPDEPAAEDQVLGRVSLVERSTGSDTVTRDDLATRCWRAYGLLIAARQALRWQVHRVAALAGRRGHRHSSTDA